MKTISKIRKIILFLFLFQLTTIGAGAQDEMIKEAEAAYSKEDYEKAAELYGELLETHGESAEIYYNLGNAYYKLNKIAPSILNYERALLLKPGDGDIRFNLQMARQKAIDKIEPVGEFFLYRWFDRLQNRGSVDAWAKAGIIFFLLFIGCLAMFFFSKRMRLKKSSFYLGLLCFASVILFNVFAHNQKDKLVNRQNAIVFAPTVTVKSSPDVSGTDLFILHEGTKVSVKSKLGDWIEIEMEDGNIGWMPGKDIEVI